MDPLQEVELTEEQRRSIRILVVDDDSSILESCESVLSTEDFRVDVYRKGAEAIRNLRSRRYDIALVDQNMPEIDGLEILSAIREHSSEALAIVMTGYASVGANLRAREAGAWDYLPKPFTATQLLVLVGRAAHRVIQLRSVGLGEGEERDPNLIVEDPVPIIGRSKELKDAVTRAMKVARTDASVFITGESGTGKELVARCIHAASKRSSERFVEVNCAALPGELMESEMFGHRKGAFTGAVRDKPGLVEMADRGTLFLDELCEMPVDLQPKLLRVLQDGVVRRVGSEEEDNVVDVRLVCATNRDVGEALEAGDLREDLYYRVRVIPIHLPPLRRRREDIPVLAEHFVRYFWRRHDRPGEQPPEVASSALQYLRGLDWPGNVRQLRNLIEQVVVLSDPGQEITGEAIRTLVDLDGEGPHGRGRAGDLLDHLDFEREYHDAKQDLIDRFESRYLRWVVSRTNGNMSEAARQAGIDRTTLYRLMDKHEVSKQELCS